MGKKTVRKDMGFTLIEVVIVLFIVLILLFPLSQMLYGTYRNSKYTESQADDLYLVQMAYWELIDGKPGERSGLRMAAEYQIRPNGIVYRVREKYIGYYLLGNDLYRNENLVSIDSPFAEGSIILEGVKIFSVENTGDRVLLVSLETGKNLGVGSRMETKVLLLLKSHHFSRTGPIDDVIFYFLQEFKKNSRNLSLFLNCLKVLL